MTRLYEFLARACVAFVLLAAVRGCTQAVRGAPAPLPRDRDDARRRPTLPVRCTFYWNGQVYEYAFVRDRGSPHAGSCEGWGRHGGRFSGTWSFDRASRTLRICERWVAPTYDGPWVDYEFRLAPDLRRIEGRDGRYWLEDKRE